MESILYLISTECTHVSEDFVLPGFKTFESYFKFLCLSMWPLHNDMCVELVALYSCHVQLHPVLSEHRSLESAN